MIKRKKILLGDKDIISREIKDFQIDIQLSRTTRELMPNKYENSFDLLKQYKKERNICRNFRLYGTIDSAFTDCDNLNIHVFSKEPKNITFPISLMPGFVKTVTTLPVISVNWECKNVFYKKRGKYLIELENYIQEDFVYIYIEGINADLQNLFKKQLVYRYETLNIMAEPIIALVPYGSEEAVVDINGKIIEVENDFDFFYNKHWINEAITINKIRKTKWIGQEGTAECLWGERVRGWIGDESHTECVLGDDSIDYGNPNGYYLIVNFSPPGVGTAVIEPVMGLYPHGTTVIINPVVIDGNYGVNNITGDIDDVSWSQADFEWTVPMTQNRIITVHFFEL